jgi:hypothetical protein
VKTAWPRGVRMLVFELSYDCVGCRCDARLHLAHGPTPEYNRYAPPFIATGLADRPTPTGC